MSQRIAILPEILTNKIAAGEVVERPASVIKELVENALDAGATEIEVEISSGGRRAIKITDNGHGMSREDALLCLERHATSKIRSDSDLDSILTLGFRGEALPSIASVSRFRLTTREPESPEGTEIIVEGGRVRDVKACGMAPGTMITVEQLFFNTPARLKFLRSAETETGHVGDCLTRMAISRPDVAFKCTSDGRELLRVQRSDLLRRLSQSLGRETSRELHAVDCSSEGITITGFISGPSAVRSTTAAMFTYINGRFVRDRVVQHAILQAYRGVIDRGRYPVCALFVNVPPDEVDVNVHPTKHEVRFRRQSAVHDALQGAVAEVLASSPWLVQRQQVVPTTTEQTTPAAPAEQDYAGRIAAAAQASLHLVHSEPRPLYRSGGTAASTTAADTSDERVRETGAAYRSAEEAVEQQGYFSSLAIIGQFHAEYILCQSDKALVIIDQHAASERVAYQRLQHQSASDGIESQRLLFPETLELSFSEVAAVQRFGDQLKRIGLELEPFGGNTVIVAAIPRIAAKTDVSQLVRDLLGELVQLGTSAAFQEVLDQLLSRIACHSVIRGVHQLEHRQIRELLHSMDQTDFAASCPHGRPVSHTITHVELEKIFKRT